MSSYGSLVITAALAASGLIPFAHADEWNKKTIVTINAPIEVPGRVLTAGTYVFKLLDSQSDRDILEIYDKNEQHLVTTVLAVSDYRNRTPGRPILKFEEAAQGSPEALRSFFYPGDNTGLQFVYPHQQALAIAQRTHQNVLAMRDGTSEHDYNGAEITGVTPSGQMVDRNSIVGTPTR